MKTFFYTLAVLIVITWSFGYFVFSLDSMGIHLLLLFAILVGLFGYKIENNNLF